MKHSALVEVSTDLDAGIKTRLVSAAYRYSRAGTVMLALKGVSRRAIDGILDPVVNMVGLKVRGTLYVEANELSRVFEEIGPETVAVGSSPEFLSQCVSRGVRTLTIEEALRSWEAVTEPAIEATAR